MAGDSLRRKVANTTLSEGQKLTIEITKPGGAGAVLSVLTLQIEYTVD